jgi:hypothetical protein
VRPSLTSHGPTGATTLSTLLTRVAILRVCHAEDATSASAALRTVALIRLCRVEAMPNGSLAPRLLVRGCRAAAPNTGTPTQPVTTRATQSTAQHEGATARTGKSGRDRPSDGITRRLPSDAAHIGHEAGTSHSVAV